MRKGNNYIRLNPWLLVVIIFLFAVICYRLTYVAVMPTVDGMDLRKFAASITHNTLPLRADRGTIYDINGEALARNATSYTVIAFLAESRTTDLTNPKHVIDKRGTAAALAEIINMDEEYIFGLLNSRAYQVELGPGGRDITEMTMQRIKSLALPGIDFIQGSRREYPFGDFASYIVGYARRNDEGIVAGEMGIELKYDGELRGSDGEEIVQMGATGFRIAGTTPIVTPAQDGHDIYLTLDSNIQLYLEKATEEIGRQSEWVTITIADATTGAILGSSTTPSFNPNSLSDDMNYSNPLTSFTYEPGSTMKIYSFMAAIEHGLYNGEEMYESGSIPVDGHTIRDWNLDGWGSINFDTGFTYSSNVAAVLLGQRLGVAKLIEFYEALGFGQKTGIELPGENTGEVDFRWNSELATAAFGQGITTTPIQNIQALTVLGNNGMLLKPYIIDRIVNRETGEVVYSGERKEIRQVASQETINYILNLMDQTVNSEDQRITGLRYQSNIIRLGGKTGTAQYIEEDGTYSTGNENTIRSFSGVFPVDNPQYIIYVSVKRWTGSNFGPYVSAIVESIATYKNIGDRPSDVDPAKIVRIENYVNKAASEIVAELQSFGLNPIVIGDGEIIIKQYPQRNTTITAGSKVFLVTNGEEIRMPDPTGWTRNEITTFANLINLTYTINGYGRVHSVSIPYNEIIIEQELQITLDRGVITSEEPEIIT